MYYVEFDIVDVARRAGVKILRQRRDGQWEARCPFCGDSRKSERRGHLYLADGGRYKCHRCGEGGYAVGFYARLRGIDTKAAYRELLRCVERVSPATQGPPVRFAEYIASDRQRHEVYTALLRSIDLEAPHRADLLRRGLTEDLIERNQYRSVPRHHRAVAVRLARDCDLSGVPGFFRKGRGWDMKSYPGYFIPVRDPDGLIQGLQVRLWNSRRKYIWFSSREEPEGAGARTWIHVAEPAGPARGPRVWVTEGPLKADVAAAYLGVRFLAVPGAAAWKRVVETVRAVKARSIVLAYDADAAENPAVAKAAGDVMEALAANGACVLSAYWPREWGKGIDDACLRLARLRREVAEGEFVALDGPEVCGPERKGLFAWLLGRVRGLRVG